MTGYPRYLTEYPNVRTTFPFYMKAERPALSHITSHRHDFLELSLMVEGRGVETINGVRHPLKPGTMMFLLPYQIHEIRYDQTVRPMLYTCNFDMELLFGANEGDWGFQALFAAQSEAALPFVQLDEAALADTLPVFSSMFEEYRGEAPWRNYRIKALLMDALVRYDRHRRGTAAERSGPRVPDEAAPAFDRRSVWPVIQYMHAHYRDPLTLSGLAERFHFNVSHLSELFKQQIGQNFVRLLHEIRIRHACSLLLSTELPVSTISMEVGCGSLQTFSRIFRQLKGCTPMEYRRRR